MLLTLLLQCLFLFSVETPAAMRGGKAQCGVWTGFCTLLCVLLILDVHGRPANISVLKDKTLNSKEENEILPPDHLNGVKMEMDGHLNRDFNKEVFLGKEIEEFEEDSEPRRNRKKLMDIFQK